MMTVIHTCSLWVYTHWNLSIVVACGLKSNGCSREVYTYTRIQCTRLEACTNMHAYRRESVDAGVYMSELHVFV